MTLQIRRMVTGHSAEGRARVEIDENVQNVISNRPGASSSEIWATEGFPVNNDDFEDPTKGPFKTSVEGGTVFRVVQYKPGVAARNHRTDSIDYAVVISGAIEMELDDGVVVKLRAGDVLVQRGTIHNWVNRGTKDCVVAFVLIGARPVKAGSVSLEAVG
jgi:quercetin dioxygenase-like cupin family protein